MTIVFDPPRPVSFRHFKTTAHLESTLLGAEGESELLAFGRRIGMRRSWLQYPGTWKVHFDIFDGRIEVARKAGAVEITHAQFRDMTRLKLSERAIARIESDAKLIAELRENGYSDQAFDNLRAENAAQEKVIAELRRAEGMVLGVNAEARAILARKGQ